MVYTAKKMSYNQDSRDINNIKNDIKSIKLIVLGILITTPIYYTSIYLLSKRACKKAYLAVTEYINNIEKNNNSCDFSSNEIDIILEEKPEDNSSSDTNSDKHELDVSAYCDVPPPVKKSFLNFY
jgi:hypothetical protein